MTVADKDMSLSDVLALLGYTHAPQDRDIYLAGPQDPAQRRGGLLRHGRRRVEVAPQDEAVAEAAMNLARAEFSDDLRDRAATWCSIFACDRACPTWSVKLHTRRDTRNANGIGGVAVADTDDEALALAYQFFVVIRRAERTWRMPHLVWAEAERILREREMPPYRPICRRGSN